jgi:hypothetical protein
MKSYRLYTRTFSPDEAREILATKNQGNRKLKKAKIAQYTAAMQAGRWRFTPVPIIFEEHSGRLLDGQNRLMALVASGRSLPFVVCDNATADIMQAIDQGASRSASDHLTTRGIHGGASLAPLLLAIIGYTSDPHGMWSVIKPVSNEEYVEAYDADALLIEESDGQGKRLNKEYKLISRTDFSFAYFLLKKAGVNQHVINDFFLRLSYGNDLAVTCPVFQYRKWLNNNSTKYAGLRNRRQHSINNILKTFGQYMEGRPSPKFSPAKVIPTPSIESVRSDGD